QRRSSKVAPYPRERRASAERRPHSTMRNDLYGRFSPHSSYGRRSSYDGRQSRYSYERGIRKSVMSRRSPSPVYRDVRSSYSYDRNINDAYKPSDFLYTPSRNDFGTARYDRRSSIRDYSRKEYRLR
ncbi:hypothetical protein PMAYCL1PPCAC_05992, partial [Pristionchus mayeri]